MAGETTPPGGATRYIQTTRGLLSYSLLAPLLATATDADLERQIRPIEVGGPVWQGTFLALGEAYEHLGRPQEAKATTVLALSLDECSCKVSDKMPEDDPADLVDEVYSGIWAGVGRLLGVGIAVTD